MAIRDIKRRPTTNATLLVIKNKETKEFKCKGVKNAHYRETGVFDTFRLVGKFVGDGEFEFEDQKGVIATRPAKGRTGALHVSKAYLDALNGMEAMAVELTSDWNYSIQLEDEEAGIDTDSLLYGSYRISLPAGKDEIEDIDACGVAGKIDDVERYLAADDANKARNDEYYAEMGKAVTEQAAEGGKKAKLL